MPTTKKQTPTEEIPDNPQPLTGFMTNEEWGKLLLQVNELINEMENLPLPEVKDKVFELLAGIDTIHREALRRLVRLFKEGVLEQVVTDPAIHTLMELYDLLPPEYDKDGKIVAEQRKVNFPDIPIKVVPVQMDNPPSVNRYPHWVPSRRNKKDIKAGTLYPLNIDNHRIILCCVENEFFVLANACSQDGSSLEDATLNKYTLSCPNHQGCYYDIRQGTRIAGEGRIDCYPVQVSPDGTLMIGIDMEFIPKLPAF